MKLRSGCCAGCGRNAKSCFWASSRRRPFFPPLEIVETPASPAGRAIGATIIVFFLLALLWAGIGSVDIIAIAPGKILSSERTKIIQPVETGVVRKIHVQDGQKVKAGEVLIEVEISIVFIGFLWTISGALRLEKGFGPFPRRNACS